MDSLREPVERFLFLEADCMDEFRLEEWMALWAPEALYWVPCNRDQADPERHVSIIYDDYARIQDRVARLGSRAAHSQVPRSRMRRLISNIVIDRDRDELVEVHSNFMLAELRHGRQDLFAGKSRHLLRIEPAGGFRIAAKTVWLINNDEPIDNLTFLI